MAPRSRSRLTLALAALLAAVLCAGCATSSLASPGPPIRVVATTDVYGDIARDIARDIAGPAVQVTSLINSLAQDPHAYEASARAELAVAKASVIVENGGGYDDFVDRMRAAAGQHTATVINVVALSGKTAPQGGNLNEHVWYDFPTMARLADRLAAVLGARQPDDAAAFHRNAARFIASLHALEGEEAAVKAQHAGTGVAVTEPVPLYLLDACGLVDKTPPQFSEAVEADTDVSASVLHRTLALFSSHAVALLVYNAQTSGAETTRVRAAAAANRIPAVPVTETLPGGTGYLGWMHDNLTAITKALAS